MKLAVLSYSHHGRSIGRTARDLGHEIVGVMNGEEDPRTQLENEFGRPGFDTAGTCLDAVEAEAALISGKHIEILSHIQACMDRCILYLVDNFPKFVGLEPITMVGAECPTPCMVVR